MIVEIAALLLATAVGVAVARLLDRTATGALLAGEGMLLGVGTAAAILLAFSLLGVPWTRSGVVVAVIVIAVIAAIVAARLRGFAVAQPGNRAILLDLVTLIFVAGYVRLATMAPLWEFDYIGDFGLKARNFFDARAVDWVFLASPLQGGIHPDYPPLLPLSFDFLALARGEWNDWAHGLLNVAFAVALLLVVRHLAFEETRSPRASAFITAALLPLAASPWIGLAEAPMVAFGTAAVLLLRSGEEARVPMAAVLLGLAASTKNEGVALIVAVAIALAMAGRARTTLRLWPAIAVPLPWTMARLAHGLGNDLTQGDVLARIVGHLRDPRSMLDAVTQYSLGKPLFWMGIVVALIVVGRRFFAAERFALGVIALQLAFYVAAYLASPHDLPWHVKWSWERLVSHLTPTLAYVILADLAAQAPRPDPPPPR